MSQELFYSKVYRPDYALKRLLYLKDLLFGFTNISICQLLAMELKKISLSSTDFRKKTASIFGSGENREKKSMQFYN